MGAGAGADRRAAPLAAAGRRADETGASGRAGIRLHGRGHAAGRIAVRAAAGVARFPGRSVVGDSRSGAGAAGAPAACAVEGGDRGADRALAGAGVLRRVVLQDAAQSASRGPGLPGRERGDCAHRPGRHRVPHAGGTVLHGTAAAGSGLAGDAGRGADAVERGFGQHAIDCAERAGLHRAQRDAAGGVLHARHGRLLPDAGNGAGGRARFHGARRRRAQRGRSGHRE